MGVNAALDLEEKLLPCTTVVVKDVLESCCMMEPKVS